MLFELISLLLGIIKLFFYKILYPFRVTFKSIPKINNHFSMAIKRGSKLSLGKDFRGRNNISFRIYNSGKVSIGDNCFMNDNCSINCQENISIGDNVIFGPNVMIFDHDHDYKKNINNFVSKSIKIGNNVWIGANVVVLKGVIIGNDCVIAANTLVRENIPDKTILYQNKVSTMKEL